MSKNKKARIAGILYLLLIICGLTYLMYIPQQLINLQNTTETINNIKNHELLFRFGIVMVICSFLVFILLPLALYSLLQSVNKLYAKFMVLFTLISVPVSFVNILNNVSSI